VIAARQPVAPVESDFDVALAVDLAVSQGLEVARPEVAAEHLAAFEREGPVIHRRRIVLAEVKTHAVRRFVDAENRDAGRDLPPRARLVRVQRPVEVALVVVEHTERLEQREARLIARALGAAPDVPVLGDHAEPAAERVERGVLLYGLRFGFHNPVGNRLYRRSSRLCT
jgi:hypothetical protein